MRRDIRRALGGIVLSFAVVTLPAAAQQVPFTPDPVLGPNAVPTDPVLGPNAVPRDPALLPQQTNPAPVLGPNTVPTDPVLGPNAVPTAPALTPQQTNPAPVLAPVPSDSLAPLPPIYPNN